MPGVRASELNSSALVRGKLRESALPLAGGADRAGAEARGGGADVALPRSGWHCAVPPSRPQPVSGSGEGLAGGNGVAPGGPSPPRLHSLHATSVTARTWSRAAAARQHRQVRLGCRRSASRPCHTPPDAPAALPFKMVGSETCPGPPQGAALPAAGGSARPPTAGNSCAAARLRPGARASLPLRPGAPDAAPGHGPHAGASAAQQPAGQPAAAAGCRAAAAAQQPAGCAVGHHGLCEPPGRSGQCAAPAHHQQRPPCSRGGAVPSAGPAAGARLRRPASSWAWCRQPGGAGGRGDVTSRPCSSNRSSGGSRSSAGTLGPRPARPAQAAHRACKGGQGVGQAALPASEAAGTAACGSCVGGGQGRWRRAVQMHNTAAAPLPPARRCRCGSSCPPCSACPRRCWALARTLRQQPTRWMQPRGAPATASSGWPCGPAAGAAAARRPPPWRLQQPRPRRLPAPLSSTCGSRSSSTLRRPLLGRCWAPACLQHRAVPAGQQAPCGLIRWRLTRRLIRWWLTPGRQQSARRLPLRAWHRRRGRRWRAPPAPARRPAPRRRCRMPASRRRRRPRSGGWL